MIIINYTIWSAFCKERRKRRHNRPCFKSKCKRLIISSLKGNARPKQNPTYKKYVILERTGVDEVIRQIASFNSCWTKWEQASSHPSQSTSKATSD